MYKGMRRSPASLIVLSVITCSIYYFYWLYKFSMDLKIFMNDESSDPGIDLLLCIFCFPYQLYWFYKYGKIMAEANARVGLPREDNSVLYLIMGFFGLHFVNAAIMQSNLNRIWDVV